MIPIFDIETAPDPAAMALIAHELDDISAPQNYKDAEKIAAYVAEKRAKRLADMAVDIDELRIVAIGADDSIVLCETEQSEVKALTAFWHIAKQWRRQMQEAGEEHILCGFCVSTFDVPAIVRRSQILGVDVPPNLLKLDRYRGNVLDLADVLTWRGSVSRFPRKLEFYLRRFGIVPADAPYSHGCDVPQWAAAGEWDKIAAHLQQDLDNTRKLAERLGVV